MPDLDNVKCTSQPGQSSQSNNRVVFINDSHDYKVNYINSHMLYVKCDISSVIPVYYRKIYHEILMYNYKTGHDLCFVKVDTS